MALSIVAAAPTDVIYARHKLKGATTWSAESETFKLTGTGTIVITGLANASRYQFSGYAKAASLESEWLGAREDIPNVGTASSAENAIRALLLDSAAVLALVSERIYPQSAPQKTPKEDQAAYIVYQRIDTDPTHTMLAAGGLAFVRVQLELYGRSYDECRQIAEAVRLALDGYQGSVTDGEGAVLNRCKIRRATDSEEFSGPIAGQGSVRHQVVVDYTVSHTEAVPTF